MPAKFIPDMHQGPGHGIIIVQPFTCQSAPLFALYRSSDKLCLDRNGWQGSEVFLEPTAWDCHENIVRLAVNEAVVNNLDKLDTYKIIIKEGEQSQSFSLLIEDIVQSTMDGGFGIGAAMEAPTPQEISRKTVVEEVAPVVEEPAPPVEPEPKIPEISQPLRFHTEQPEEKKGSKLIPILLLILLLLVAGVAAFWWYLHKQTEDTQKSPIEQATQKDKDANATKDAANEAKDKDSQDKKSSDGASLVVPIDAARALLRKNATGEESQALAQQLEKEGKEAASKLKDDAAKQKEAAARQDAIFLLIEDAAQKGIPTAMTQLGAFYDPSLHKMYGSIPADLEQAHSWYKQALQGGDTKAQASLDSLRTWAETAAKGGDKTAQNLLEKW